MHDTAGTIRLSQHAAPDVLLRYGLTDRLELRLGWPGYVHTRLIDGSASESIDEVLVPNVGLMFDLWPQRGLLPQTAALAAVPITRSGDPFALQGLQPLAQVLYRWELSDRWACGGTTALALFDVEGGEFLQFQQAVNADYLLSERTAALLEWQMLSDGRGTSRQVQHLLSGGVWRQLTPRLDVSWRIGLGLNDAAPDLLTDLRFGYRF